MDHIWYLYCIFWYYLNPTGGGGWIPPPYLRFLLVKILLIDIFTIPSDRIPEILLAIRKWNKIWKFFWVRGGGRGLFDPKSAKKRQLWFGWCVVSGLLKSSQKVFSSCYHSVVTKGDKSKPYQGYLKQSIY